MLRVMMRSQSLVNDEGKTEAEAIGDALFENVAKPIAWQFGVSPPAMRIRLEKLGLLLREAPQQASLSVDQYPFFFQRELSVNWTSK